MEKHCRRLEENVRNLIEGFSDIDDKLASVRLSEDKWSLKDIIGHLIDSAANNYQRFIRLQETDRLSFPAYDYNWIKIVKYNSLPFSQILELWKQFNLLICHMISEADSTKMKNVWLFEGKELSLEFLIGDYIDHMELHLKQLEQRFHEIQQYSASAGSEGRSDE